MTEPSVNVDRKESQSSYEFGPAGARHKVYYWEVSDLKAHLEALKAVLNETVNTEAK